MGAAGDVAIIEATILGSLGDQEKSADHGLKTLAWILLVRETAPAPIAEALGSKLGTRIWNQNEIGDPGALEVPDLVGGPSRTRTLDPLIKRRGPAPSRPSVFLHGFA